MSEASSEIETWHAELGDRNQRGNSVEWWRFARPPGYIVTTADTLVPPGSQRAVAASIGPRVSEIHTDHGPFREEPERLAELLVGAVADRE